MGEPVTAWEPSTLLCGSLCQASRVIIGRSPGASEQPLRGPHTPIQQAINRTPYCCNTVTSVGALGLTQVEGAQAERIPS
jgi:hypothetical protein